MAGVLIVLPWPNRRLSPNSRGHWAALHRARKKARWDASYLAYDAMNGQAEALREAYEGDDPIAIRVSFFPPDRRRRDTDNMIASLKAAIDGVADALGVSDHRFRPHYFFEAPDEPGRVEVRIG